ncbi:aldose 1-epimerase family protein [Mesorhizobium sp. XAP10]|uniref:aldose 1-epimerase family protein n=1 Tax=unclassified Mesorhizobium TaxID=325217 RepID=UPI0023DF7148|nr:MULTISPECIES: aldose 1-epimerase family protein [unclassified Mesorhizobium]MDF3154537.1 aldose 1-epimerase family protein [Mesorhizobium sp. XAP10]MDF3247913.1 aldose 1-epimerase family protein [Mesorhizobium sp. XAP4]
MVKLYGRTLKRRDIAERAGMLSQFAGVRLMTLDNGVERGVRVLEFRTGAGLRFTLMVDRAMDIADCEHKGRAIGWHSPAGFRHPGLHDDESEGGLGFIRSMSGLVTTCGLDHTLKPAEVPADNYNSSARQTVRHGLHGRIGFIPARLTGYGETWTGDDCVLWAEGIVQQSTLFGEDLHLHRRVEADVGGTAIRIRDRVVNHGFYRTPHMLLYHVNVGHPLLEEGSRFLAPIGDVVWASHDGPEYRGQGVGYRTAAAPRSGFNEQVWEHDTVADRSGVVPAALVNDRLGLGFLVESRKDQLPCLLQWQNLQAGQYVVGLEPSTHHILGDLEARERGEMIWLEHGEERCYDLTLQVLDGSAEIASAEARISAIAAQPDDDYPAPSGNFKPLRKQP